MCVSDLVFECNIIEYKKTTVILAVSNLLMNL